MKQNPLPVEKENNSYKTLHDVQYGKYHGSLKTQIDVQYFNHNMPLSLDLSSKDVLR